MKMKLLKFMRRFLRNITRKAKEVILLFAGLLLLSQNWQSDLRASKPRFKKLPTPTQIIWTLRFNKELVSSYSFLTRIGMRKESVSSSLFHSRVMKTCLLMQQIDPFSMMRMEIEILPQHMTQRKEHPRPRIQVNNSRLAIVKRLVIWLILIASSVVAQIIASLKTNSNSKTTHKET